MTRQERKATALRPWKRLTAGYSILALVIFIGLNIVYYKGQTNWIGLFLVSAVPFFSVAENLAEYRLSDEYEKSLMLRAMGIATLGMMTVLYVLAVIGAADQQVPAGWSLAVILLGWLIYGVARKVLERRESQE